MVAVLAGNPGGGKITDNGNGTKTITMADGTKLLQDNAGNITKITDTAKAGLNALKNNTQQQQQSGMNPMMMMALMKNPNAMQAIASLIPTKGL